MIWGIGKFTEGMQKSDEAYQTKRQKNLAFYREWRQLFPDAPIADHQNVIDTLAGGSSYLKQQLPSTDALRSYATERDRQREIRDRQLEFQHLNSKLSAYDTLRKQVKDKIGIEGNFADLVKTVEGLYPEGSAGASIASDLMKTFEPEFKAVQQDKKFKMAERLAKAAKDTGEGDLKMVAASVGLKPTADVLKLAEAINKNTYKKDREKGLREINNWARTNPTIQFLMNRGGKKDLQQVQDLIAGEARNYGLDKLNETELASLNTNLKAYSAADAPRKAEEAIITVTQNADIMKNLRSFMIKQGGRPDLPPGSTFEGALRDEIARYASPNLPVAAKNFYVDAVYKQLTSRSNLNAARSNFIQNNVPTIIAQNLKTALEIANAIPGLDVVKNRALIDELMTAAKAQQAIKENEKLIKINEDISKDSDLQERLKSTDPNVRSMAINDIKNRYKYEGVGDKFPEMEWTAKSLIAGLNQIPKNMNDEFQRIIGDEKATAVIVALLSDGRTEAAKANVKNLIDTSKISSPDDLNNLTNKILQQMVAVSGAKSLQTATTQKINYRKAGTEYYDLERKRLIEAASAAGEAFAVSKGISTTDKAPAIGVALKAVMASNDNLSGRNILTDIVQEAWNLSGKDDTAFFENAQRLMQEAADNISGAKNYSGGRSNFVSTYVAQNTVDPKSVEEVVKNLNDIEAKLQALPDKLTSVASNFHRSKDGQWVGTDDEQKYELFKEQKLTPLINDLIRIQKLLVTDNVILGSLPDDLGVQLKALMKQAAELSEEENRVSARLRAEREFTQMMSQDLSGVTGYRTPTTNALGYVPSSVVGGQPVPPQ